MSNSSTNKKSNKSSFEKKFKNDNKTPNPKYVDVLDVDPEIAGQKFACMSFISPEKIIKNREIFYFNAFLKNWEFNKSMEKFHDFMGFISHKYKLPIESIMKDLEEFAKEEQQTLSYSSLDNDYKTFVEKHKDRISEEYEKENKFQTSIRGIKYRGAFPSQGEAELHAKKLREMDPNHNIFVGPVGTWLPWDPEPLETGRVEYIEEELNQLVHEKLNNEQQAKLDFEARVKEAKLKAIEENKKNADKTGNKLTQAVDEDGNLYGISESSVETEILDKNVTELSVEELRNTLFDGENIITTKGGDHGESALLSKLAPR